MSKSYFRNRIGLGIAAAMVAAGCERPSAGKTGHPARAVTKVEVVKPERQTVRRSVSEPGQLEAVETTPIHAKIAGYVRAVNTDIGYEIKKGQVLAELYVPELEAEVKQKAAAVGQAQAKKAQAEAAVKVAQAAVTSSEAKLATVKAGVKRVEADLTRWQQEYRRIEQLFNERAQTGTLLDETRSKLRSSESARDEVGAQVRSAEAALVESRASLDQALSDVAAADSNLDVTREDSRRVEALLGYTRIEAPYDGIIIRRNVDTGHLTRPGADAPPLFVAARSDVVTIVVDIPETYSMDVNTGDRATVKLQAMNGRTVEGTVTRTSWALDSKTRTIRTEIDIPNPGGKLRPGLYAYATVIVEEHKDVLTIPTTAIGQEKEKAFCVGVRGGKAVRLPVEVGLSDGTKSEILAGLAGDEMVVKVFTPSLTDGQLVEPAEPANAPPAATKR
jgi:RND family efflux transporter MFP subunit